MTKNDSLAKSLYFPWVKNLLTAAVASGITLKTGPNGIPLALLLSTTFSTLLDATYNEFESRVLSPRQKYRTDLVLITALKEIESRIDGGALLRDDGFFTDISSGRTDAEEVLDAVVLKAKDQYQEKKLPHFGACFARIAYSTESAAFTNYLLNAAESLSYRQFLLLAHVSKVGVLEGEPIRGRKHTLSELQAFRAEEMMLIDKAEFGGVGFLEALGLYDSKLSPMGLAFVDLFAIDKIPAHEILEITRLISRCAEDPKHQ